MPAPAITITGTLQDILGALDNGAQLVIQLCGFGTQLPRISGTALLAKTAPLAIQVGAPGTFSQLIYGNDVILPSGTYYVITVLDEQQNVIQCNAYQFTGAGSFDLSTVTPYNPNPAVVGAPAGLAVSSLLILPFAANLTMPAAAPVTAFKITLTGNIVSNVLTTPVVAQVYTFMIVQDSTGSRTWIWPSNVKNAEAPSALANSKSVQSFICLDDGNLYPIGPMTIN